jgi:hypothetical protein
VSPISYSIKVDIQRLKCNIGKQAPSKQHVLALLACVTDLVGGSSPNNAVKTSPKNCLLVPGTSLFQRSFSMHHAHTSSLSNVRLLNIQSKAGMQRQSKNNAMTPGP